MTDDPFVLLAGSDEDWPPDADFVRAAVNAFDPQSPEPLQALLRSPDEFVSRRGLNVFAELGRKGFVVLNAALALSRHPHDMARNALMDGVICYPARLDPRQARTILPLIGDPFSLVREKVVCYLSCADVATLDAAIGFLDEPLRPAHRAGLDVLRATHTDAQALFDSALARRDVPSAYALACVERMARRGVLRHEIAYAGDDRVAEGVAWQVKRFVHRRKNLRLRS